MQTKQSKKQIIDSIINDFETRKEARISLENKWKNN